MQFAGVSPAAAPLATGHPQGLPAAPEGPPVETKVQPVLPQSRTGTDPQPGGQPPASFWRGLSGLPDPASHVAPPSIVQIKISAILEKQAEKLMDEARATEIAARMARTAEDRAAQAEERTPPRGRPSEPAEPTAEPEPVTRPYGAGDPFGQDNVFSAPD